LPIDALKSEVEDKDVMVDIVRRAFDLDTGMKSEIESSRKQGGDEEKS
jgi:hypothetical protein